MPHLELKRWDNDVVIHSGEFASLSELVQDAVRKDVSMYRSNLSGSNLSGSDLRGSDLRGSNLRGSDLRGSDLKTVRADFWSVLMFAPHEVPALRTALVEGRVNGSTYSGDCACLVGTIANAKHCDIQSIPGLKPDSDRPA